MSINSPTGGSPSVVVKPVVNAIRIIHHLAECGAPERAADIARQLAINPSTCFNILRTLAAEDMIDFDSASKTYKPGIGLARLASQLVGQGQRLDSARPLMREFAVRHQVTVTLWRKMANDRIVLVSSEASPSNLRIDMAIGQRLPLLMGASGRLFAAEMGLNDGAMRTAFAQVRWARPLAFEDYVHQLELARQRDWAVDDGYFSAGIMAIAAPVRDRSGHIAFTASAVMFRGQHTGDAVDTLGTEMVALAHKLSYLLC